MRNLSHEESERLVKLGLTTLERRRCRGDMIEVHKILHGRENIDGKQFFNLAENSKYNQDVTLSSSGKIDHDSTSGNTSIVKEQ